MIFKVSVKRCLQCIQFAVIPENIELLTPQEKMFYLLLHLKDLS